LAAVPANASAAATVLRLPDRLFDDRRLAEIYDPLDPDRSDLDVYAAMVAELGAHSVLDVGCGTGTFACRLALQGCDVVGVDPAGASLQVARAKPGAERVRWLHGDATNLPPLQVDLATMTANVAQVFLTDEDWHSTLLGIHRALRPGGHLVFETRDPARRAWAEWSREQSYSRREVPGRGLVESWVEVGDVSGDLVTFTSTFVFAPNSDSDSDSAVLTSESTLCFRGRENVEATLLTAGFDLDEVRDAPDRPGREFVFVSRRST